MSNAEGGTRHTLHKAVIVSSQPAHTPVLLQAVRKAATGHQLLLYLI